MPSEDDNDRPFYAQSILRDMVRKYQAGGGWLSLNPRAGRGFTRDTLMALERRRDVAEYLGLVRGFRSTTK